LTIGEIEQLEEIAGVPFGTVASRMQSGQWAITDICAWVIVLSERDGKKLTLDEVRTWPLSRLEQEFTRVMSHPPTDAAPGAAN
jgi:hypothetical protein